MKFTAAVALLLSASVAATDSIRGGGSHRELQACASLQTDKYCHLIDQSSKLALNVADAATWSGASAVQWEELNDAHDNWKFEPASDGHYTLVAEHSGLALFGIGRNTGDNVVQSNQKDEWCFVDQGNGSYEVKNRKTGMVLDTVDGSRGASVVLKPGGKGGNQNWSVSCFKSVWKSPDVCAKVPTNKYCHIVAKHSQQALSVAGGNVQQTWESKDKNENWQFESGSDGRYTATNEESGMGLHVQGNTNGANVDQDKNKDEWCFVDKGDNYYEVKNQNGLALDVEKQGTAPGSNAIIWKYGDGQANRLFRLNCDKTINNDKGKAARVAARQEKRKADRIADRREERKNARVEERKNDRKKGKNDTKKTGKKGYKN